MKCPKCQVALRLTPNLAGRTVKCGGCGASLRLPEKIEAEPPGDPVRHPADDEISEFVINCPCCQEALLVGPEDVGLEAPCPACHVPFRVPNGPGFWNKTELPADEIPADEIPADEIPADEIPADEIPADEIPADEIPADEIPEDESLLPTPPTATPTINIAALLSPKPDSGTDIYISYSNSDRDHARIIVNYLESEGKTVFFDQTDHKGGANWFNGLESKLAECQSFAVLLGLNGMGRVQQAEKNLALARRIAEPDFPVIPVLLPGNVDPPKGLLSLETWIDLRSDPQDIRGLARLKAAVENIESMGVVNDPRNEVCPYRGMRPFREEDSPYFFGRTREIRDLVERVVSKRYPVVPVIGRFGSGKSSLVYAGLFPELRKANHGTAWEILTLRPLGEPLQQLMGVLSPPSEEVSRAQQLADLNNAADLFRKGRVSIPQLIEDILKENEGSERVLIFVDQWEELYREAPRNGKPGELEQFEGDRTLFIDSLLDASANSPCTVVFTVRADFYDQILLHSGLTRHVDQHSLSLGPMGDEEILDSIEKPAEKAGYQFESGLVERILPDASGRGGRLPMLLRELWERREGWEFTQQGYDAAVGAIAIQGYEVGRDHGDEVAESIDHSVTLPESGERKNRLFQRIVISVTSVLAIGSIIGAIFGFSQSKIAEREREMARGELKTAQNELVTMRGDLETAQTELETTRREFETAQVEKYRPGEAEARVENDGDKLTPIQKFAFVREVLGEPSARGRPSGELNDIASQWLTTLPDHFKQDLARDFSRSARKFAMSEDETEHAASEALRLATLACVCTEWKNSLYLAILASVHAEAGTYKNAIECQKKALKLAEVDKKEDYQALLRLYMAGNPDR